MPRGAWEVEFHPACERWADALDQATPRPCLLAFASSGTSAPTLGRPLVDTIVGSRHKNMKELRPGSTGRSEIRVLFAFDRARKAILLVGGDKRNDWSGWYDLNIPIADDRLDQHQAMTKKRQEANPPDKTKPRKGKRQ